ncbi:ankyrin repeat domain protein, partial [Lactarius tabidus]
IASSSMISYKAKDTVRLLIEHGASVNAYDKNHQTPLHRVSSCSPNTDSLRLLLENGADVDVEDDEGLTPFQIASSKGHHEIAQLLLDHRSSIVSNTL